jgi:cellulose synthase/poly-beta-1,6-N-acetylglucosamine synthase-like glycosyltransferase
VAYVTGPHPACTVIVPTHSRPRQLAACLEALSRLDYPRDRYDVIVVDDEGSLPAAPVVEAFHSRLSVTLLVQKRAGPGGARNAGAGQARGDLLAFIDDDCRPAEDWLSQLAVGLRRSPSERSGVVRSTASPTTSTPRSASS